MRMSGPCRFCVGSFCFQLPRELQDLDLVVMLLHDVSAVLHSALTFGSSIATAADVQVIGVAYLNPKPQTTLCYSHTPFKGTPKTEPKTLNPL